MKTKTTFYDERVPKGVRDIMGDVPCEYILHYNTVHWKNSVFLDDRKPKLRSEICKTEYMPEDFETVYTLMNQIKNDPNFISARIDGEIINAKYKYVPTELDIAEYELKLSQYNDAAEKFKKLTKFIAGWSDSPENLDYEAKYFELKTKYDNLTKILKDLK